VSWIVYIPVCDYIRLFRFSPADILSVVFGWGRFRWVLTFWQVWVYRAGRGWVVMMISVLGAHACVRVCACMRTRVRVRACAELRVYTSTVPS